MNVEVDRCEVNEDDYDCEDEGGDKDGTMKMMEMEMFKLMDMFHLS